MPVSIHNAETILTFGKLLKSHLFDLAFQFSPSVVRLPADETALASIMTHGHAKDLSASELSPLRIQVL